MNKKIGPKIEYKYLSDSPKCLQKHCDDEDPFDLIDYDPILEILRQESGNQLLKYYLLDSKNQSNSASKTIQCSSKTRKTCLTFNNALVVCYFDQSQPPKNIQETLNDLERAHISWVNPEAYKKIKFLSNK